MSKMLRGLIVPILLVAMNCQASFVAGADSFRDASSGLEWLHVYKTIGAPYNTVLGSSYVVHDGYAFATQAQVLQLFRNAGGAEEFYNWRPENVGPADNLMSLFGGCTSYIYPTRQCGSPDEYWTMGMWGAPETRGIHIAMVDVMYAERGFLAIDAWANTTIPLNTVHRPDVASFLVRAARVYAVPEPGSFALLLVGLVSLVAFWGGRVAALRRAAACA
jgi:hypothetical protein